MDTGTEPIMDTNDWRAQLQPDSRQRIVNKMYVSVLIFYSRGELNELFPFVTYHSY